MRFSPEEKKFYVKAEKTLRESAEESSLGALARTQRAPWGLRHSRANNFHAPAVKCFVRVPLARLAAGEEARASAPSRGDPRKSSHGSHDDQREYSPDRRAIAPLFAGTRDERRRTIGVSRCGRQRPEVRGSSPRVYNYEPYHVRASLITNSTILPSISKLALYPCKERKRERNALYLVSLPLFLSSLPVCLLYTLSS